MKKTTKQMQSASQERENEVVSAQVNAVESNTTSQEVETMQAHTPGDYKPGKTYTSPYTDNVVEVIDVTLVENSTTGKNKREYTIRVNDGEERKVNSPELRDILGFPHVVSERKERTTLGAPTIERIPLMHKAYSKEFVRLMQKAQNAFAEIAKLNTRYHFATNAQSAKEVIKSQYIAFADFESTYKAIIAEVEEKKAKAREEKQQIADAKKGMSDADFLEFLAWKKAKAESENK